MGGAPTPGRVHVPKCARLISIVFSGRLVFVNRHQLRIPESSASQLSTCARNYVFYRFTRWVRICYRRHSISFRSFPIEIILKNVGYGTTIVPRISAYYPLMGYSCVLFRLFLYVIYRLIRKFVQFTIKV